MMADDNQQGAAGGDGQQGQGEQQGQGGGQPGESWLSALPEDLRGAPSLQNVRDVAHLAKQFVDTQSALGGALRIPSENASDDDWAAFRKRVADKVPNLVELNATDPEAVRLTMRQLGAPAEASGYKLPEGLGEGRADLRPVQEFAEWAHSANLTQSQFEAIATQFTKAQTMRAEAAAAEHNAGMESLRKDWGMAYSERVTGIATMLRAYDAPQEMVEAVQAGKVRPELMRLFAAVSDSVMGDGKSPNDRVRDLQRRSQLTPEEARAQLDEIDNNPEHPYWKARPGSPEHARAIERYQKLLVQADPSLRSPHAVLGGGADALDEG